MIPLSDAPNPQRLPVATYALIAANVLVYLLFNLPLGSQPANRSDPRLAEYVQTMRQALPPDVPAEALLQNVSEFDLFVWDHGFRPAAPQAVDLLTSMFMHGGFMHLFGNMLFLWIYGDNVEYRLGRLKYLFWYIVTGLAATLFFTAVTPGSLVPLVGASGAISGVLGFYFLWFPRNVVRMFVFLFPFFMNVVTIPARIVLGFYLFVDNLLPFMFSMGQRGGGVARGAHIGGFVAGVAVAWFLNRRETNAVPADLPAVEGGRVPTGGEAVAAAIRAGDMPAAARAYFGLTQEQSRKVLDPDASVALGDWLAANGNHEAALVVFRRHLRDYPRSPRAAEAHVGAGIIELQARRQAAVAYQHFMDALDLDPAPAVAEQARRGIEAIRAMQKYPMRRFADR